jgi:hypothetical protein
MTLVYDDPIGKSATSDDAEDAVAFLPVPDAVTARRHGSGHLEAGTSPGEPAGGGYVPARCAARRPPAKAAGRPRMIA